MKGTTAGPYVQTRRRPDGTFVLHGAATDTRRCGIYAGQRPAQCRQYTCAEDERSGRTSNSDRRHQSGVDRRWAMDPGTGAASRSSCPRRKDGQSIADRVIRARARGDGRAGVASVALSLHEQLAWLTTAAHRPGRHIRQPIPAGNVSCEHLHPVASVQALRRRASKLVARRTATSTLIAVGSSPPACHVAHDGAGVRRLDRRGIAEGAPRAMPGGAHRAAIQRRLKTVSPSHADADRLR